MGGCVAGLSGNIDHLNLSLSWIELSWVEVELGNIWQYLLIISHIWKPKDNMKSSYNSCMIILFWNFFGFTDCDIVTWASSRGALLLTRHFWISDKFYNLRPPRIDILPPITDIVQKNFCLLIMTPPLGWNFYQNNCNVYPFTNQYFPGQKIATLGSNLKLNLNWILASTISQVGPKTDLL